MELRAAKLITLTKSRLVIDDCDGLKDAGQFDAEYLHLRPRASAHTECATALREIF
jgi:hypothetical protein